MIPLLSLTLSCIFGSGMMKMMLREFFIRHYRYFCPEDKPNSFSGASFSVTL